MQPTAWDLFDMYRAGRKTEAVANLRRYNGLLTNTHAYNIFDESVRLNSVDPIYAALDAGRAAQPTFTPRPYSHYQRGPAVDTAAWWMMVESARFSSPITVVADGTAAHLWAEASRHGRKIQAIKDVRSITHLGLYEAKQVIDHACTLSEPIGVEFLKRVLGETPPEPEVPEPQKVYLVTEGEYDEYHIHTVAATEELAQQWIDLHPVSERQFMKIDERDLIVTTPDKWFWFTARVYQERDGEVVEHVEEHVEYHEPWTPNENQLEPRVYRATRSVLNPNHVKGTPNSKWLKIPYVEAQFSDLSAAEALRSAKEAFKLDIERNGQP